MSGGKYVDSEGHLYTVPTREQGNIYKPHNKDMADEMNERQVYDAHTKEIDLVNRDPKHLNDHVVKRKIGWLECQHAISVPLSYLSPWLRHPKKGAHSMHWLFFLMVRQRSCAASGDAKFPWTWAQASVLRVSSAWHREETPSH
ncbi:caveolin-1 isoform X3 [Myotis myotis]|uniref:caveolin-1 isoform X3 n=1 Tax=Myotis myotis TaxID=51298 RepID=UPI00174E84AA|nr:caveolin-1 isoform X3 [Myotis myotis]